MSSLLIKLILAAGPAIPAIVTDFTKALKDAEANDDAKVKAKALLADAIDILETIAKAL